MKKLTLIMTIILTLASTIAKADDNSVATKGWILLAHISNLYSSKPFCLAIGTDINVKLDISKPPHNGINVLCNGNPSHANAGTTFYCDVPKHPKDVKCTVTISNDDSTTNTSSESIYYIRK